MRNLGLFTKFWQPGTVKTRLARDIGNAAAAAIYRAMVEHLAAKLSKCADARVLVISPDAQVANPEFATMKHWTQVPQGSGDLGDRMMRFFQRAASIEDVTLVIGGDCPTLDAQVVDNAFETLGDHDAVIGPSADGGYYLLGLRGAWQPSRAALFEQMPWGTEDILPRTLATLKQLQLSYALLEEDRDVDTIEDLNQLLASATAMDPQAELKKKISNLLNASDRNRFDCD